MAYRSIIIGTGRNAAIGPSMTCRQARIYQHQTSRAESATRYYGSKTRSEAELTGVPALVILYRMSDLTPELARLSPRQRLDLIESLWESLEDKDIPVTDAQRAELDRRIAGFDQDREHSVSWDQLKAELRQRS